MIAATDTPLSPDELGHLTSTVEVWTVLVIGDVAGHCYEATGTDSVVLQTALNDWKAEHGPDLSRVTIHIQRLEPQVRQ